jgi:uncharacterized protein YlzI (FlbEa/FlbD family)
VTADEILTKKDKDNETQPKVNTVEIETDKNPDNLITLPSGKKVSKKKYESIQKLKEKHNEYVSKIKKIKKGHKKDDNEIDSKNDNEHVNESNKVVESHNESLQTTNNEIITKDKSNTSYLLYVVLIIFGGILILYYFLKNRDVESQEGD